MTIRFMKYLKAKLRNIWFLTLYVLIETCILFFLLVISCALTFWLSRLISLLVTDDDVGDVGQCYILAYTLGILTCAFPQSWKTSMTPSSLLHFQDIGNPVTFQVFRNLLVIFTILGSLLTQCTLYSLKYPETDDPSLIRPGAANSTETAEFSHLENFWVTTKLQYFMDIMFLGSVALLIHVLSRVLWMNRKITWRKMKRELVLIGTPPDLIQRSSVSSYVFYYMGFLVFESVPVPLFGLFLTGACAGLHLLVFSNIWFAYLCTLVLGGVLGQLKAVQERYFCLVGKHFMSLDPYVSAIEWDARLNVVSFTLVPALCVWYFELYFRPESDSSSTVTFMTSTSIQHGYLINFYLFTGTSSTLILYLLKCQTLFSFVILEARLLFCGVSPLGEGHDPENDRGRLLFLLLKTKSLLRGYFPLNLDKLLPGRSNLGQDRRSISTGTCRSLLHPPSAPDKNANLDLAASGSKTPPLERVLSELEDQAPIVSQNDNQEENMELWPRWKNKKDYDPDLPKVTVNMLTDVTIFPKVKVLKEMKEAEADEVFDENSNPFLETGQLDDTEAEVKNDAIPTMEIEKVTEAPGQHIEVKDQINSSSSGIKLKRCNSMQHIDHLTE